MLRTIKDFDVKGKRVLLRSCLNVPLDEQGNIDDDFRIKQALTTIRYLIENKAKIILMGHLGRPGGEVVKSLSFEPVQKRLTELLGRAVKFSSDCIGKEIENQTLKMRDGEILLLENLRFHKQEQENSPDFARELAKLGDIYINDAFADSSSRDASVVEIVKYLPSGAGFLLEKEFKVLSEVLKNPRRPLVSIIGGIKIEKKIKVIENLLEKSDNLLLGGEIANTILRVKGICANRPLPSEEIIEKVEGLNLTSSKLHLPVDVMASPDKTGREYVREAALGKVKENEMLLDIGPETINIFSKVIKTAKIIVWAGPLGLFEEPLFEKGTRSIAEEIVKNNQAFKIVGGGDTLFAVSKFGLRERFDHIFAGGGAMLSFLAGEELPGISVLKR